MYRNYISILLTYKVFFSFFQNRPHYRTWFLVMNVPQSHLGNLQSQCLGHTRHRMSSLPDFNAQSRMKRWVWLWGVKFHTIDFPPRVSLPYACKLILIFWHITLYKPRCTLDDICEVRSHFRLLPGVCTVPTGTLESHHRRDPDFWEVTETLWKPTEMAEEGLHTGWTLHSNRACFLFS